ncbi:MAG: T9SS type A sorting domain-containing protein [Flavobacteriales bacterium]|nr:MAG: T9SS type A sorting domain-containing protein [Flavobacteriales bacterium]
MKKALFTIAASIGLATLGVAQTPVITNGTFELWTNINAPAFPPGAPALERPNGWYGSDQLLNHTVGPLFLAQSLDFDYNKQLFKDADMHEGAFAAKLMTKDFGDTLKKVPVLMTNAKQNVSLSALLGADFDNIDLMSLFRFSECTPMYGKRIDSITAYVKTPATNADSGAVFVLAYQKVQSSSGTDSNAVIGQGGMTVAPNSNGYIKIAVPVMYTAGQATDSMVVGFVSSSADFTVDNTLFVDHVEIFASTPSSVSTVKATDLGFQVYPNPATTQINFNNKGNMMHTILIIQNSVGQIMHYAPLGQGINTIDLGKYAAGTYFYEVYNEKGTARQTGKFVK